jgi:mRNA-degrading endonuclease RelE of RelBE toxin-antitoxin system
MKIERTEVFKKDYRRLPAKTQKATAKQVTQILIDHTHPSLRIEGIAGKKGLFSVRVDSRYRISLAFTDRDTVLLRRILDRDDLYRNP